MSIPAQHFFHPWNGSQILNDFVNRCTERTDNFCGQPLSSDITVHFIVCMIDEWWRASKTKRQEPIGIGLPSDLLLLTDWQAEICVHCPRQTKLFTARRVEIFVHNFSVFFWGYGHICLLASQSIEGGQRVNLFLWAPDVFPRPDRSRVNNKPIGECLHSTVGVWVKEFQTLKDIWNEWIHFSFFGVLSQMY